MAQLVKNPPARQELHETQVRSLGGEDHLEPQTEWVFYSLFLDLVRCSEKEWGIQQLEKGSLGDVGLRMRLATPVGKA